MVNPEVHQENASEDVDKLKAAAVSKIIELLEVQGAISDRARRMISSIRYSVLPEISRELICAQIDSIAVATSKLIERQVEDFMAKGVPGLTIEYADLTLAMKVEADLDGSDLPPQRPIYPVESEPREETDKVRAKRGAKRRPVKKNSKSPARKRKNG